MFEHNILEVRPQIDSKLNFASIRVLTFFIGIFPIGNFLFQCLLLNIIVVGLLFGGKVIIFNLSFIVVMYQLILLLYIFNIRCQQGEKETLRLRVEQF